MKILLVIGFYMDNHSYRENYYARELFNKGHDVKVVTSDLLYPFNNLSKEQRTIRKYDNIDSFVIRRKHLFNLKDMVYFKFKDILDDFKPDLVHIMEARQLIPYFVSSEAKKRNIPVVYEHEQRTDYGSILGIIRNKTVVHFFIKKTVLRANAIRTVSSESLNYLNKYCDLNGKVTQVSTLGYDENYYYYDLNKRKKVRNKFLINENELLIVTTGKFLGNKRLDILVDVFKKLNVKFLIVGDIQEKIDVPVDSNIFIIPKLLNNEELSEVFNAADFAIWSRYTISYFQALGCGCPIIVPNDLYTLELKRKMNLSNSINLFDIVPNQDEYLYMMEEKDIKKNIEKLVVNLISINKFDRKKISEEARKFSWNQIVDDLILFYKGIIKK